MTDMENIEVEIRSFLTPERFAVLIERLKLEGEYLGEDEQVTYYFDCEQDLRIQQNSTCSKIWLKKGRLHDEHREEIEVKMDREHFGTLERLFCALGHGIEVKWYRTRHTFKWNDTTVTLDNTKGYGHIIELERMSSESEKDRVLNELKMHLHELGVTLTPRHEFQHRYEYYKEHWQKLTEDTHAPA